MDGDVGVVVTWSTRCTTMSRLLLIAPSSGEKNDTNRAGERRGGSDMVR